MTTKKAAPKKTAAARGSEPEYFANANLRKLSDVFMSLNHDWATVNSYCTWVWTQGDIPAAARLCNTTQRELTRRVLMALRSTSLAAAMSRVTGVSV